jgi:hypothetical protein
MTHSRKFRTVRWGFISRVFGKPLALDLAARSPLLGRAHLRSRFDRHRLTYVPATNGCPMLGRQFGRYTSRAPFSEHLFAPPADVFPMLSGELSTAVRFSDFAFYIFRHRNPAETFPAVRHVDQGSVATSTYSAYECDLDLAGLRAREPFPNLNLRQLAASASDDRRKTVVRTLSLPFVMKPSLPAALPDVAGRPVGAEKDVDVIIGSHQKPSLFPRAIAIP